MSNGMSDGFTWGCSPPDRNGQFPLQHHPVAEDGRHLDLGKREGGKEHESEGKNRSVED